MLGALTNAAVEVFHCNDLTTPIFATTTSDSPSLSEAGLFDVPESILEDDELYVITISGGEDIDADDDGVIDDSPTDNQGALHLAATGDQLKAGDFKVNILTDFVFKKAAYCILSGFLRENSLEAMDQYVSTVLKDDCNSDGVKDVLDAMAWSPLLDKNKTYLSGTFFEDYADTIHNGKTHSDEFWKLRRGMTADLDDFRAVRLRLAEDYLLVADRGDLLVIDIHDNANPVIVGMADDFCGRRNSVYDIEASGHYAYLSSDGCDLAIVDVSDKTAPLLTGEFEISGYARGIPIADSYAYLSCDSGHLRVVDISDPFNPSKIGGTHPTSYVYAIEISGEYAYAAENNSFEVIDISDKFNPAVIVSIDIPKNQSTFREFSLSNGFAYALSDYAVIVIDIGDPHDPKIEGVIEPDTSTLTNICTVDEYVYLTDWYHNLHVVPAIPGH